MTIRIHLPLFLLTLFLFSACQESATAPESDQLDIPIVPVDTGHVQFQGELNAFYIGHSANNDIIDDHVATLANLQNPQTVVNSVTLTNGDIAIRDKFDREPMASIMNGGSHDFHFAVLTEQWDMQNYDPVAHGRDTSRAVTGCPENYQPPAEWANPAEEWTPIPYYLQQAVDALECGNEEVITYFYQTWTTGHPFVTDGATRPSDQNFRRPSYDEIIQDIQSGVLDRDLPVGNQMEYEGVKWQHFVYSANRPDIRFIPGGFVLSRVVKEIEAGTMPGFEAVASTNGIAADGRMAWTDWIFHPDGYHLSTVGQYLMALTIYATVFNQSPEGLEVSENLSETFFPVSEWFPEEQYPLLGISDEFYEELLTTTGSDGIYDLKGYNGWDYLHDELRLHLQRLVWDVVQNESSYRSEMLLTIEP